MSLFKNVAFLVVAVVFGKAVGFLQSFVVAHSLEPLGFGSWITLLLIVSYSPILCLGTMETMLKEVPFLIGRRDTERIRQIEGGVLGSILVAAGFFVVAGATTAALPATGLPNVQPHMLAIWLLAIGTGCLSSFFYFRFAAYESFAWVSKMEMARSILAFFFIGGFAWLWGLVGAVLGYLIHELGMCAILSYYNIRTHGAVKASFEWDLLKHVVKVGFPITILWWVLMLQATVDRVVLGAMLTPDTVGYFGLGISVVSAVALVPMTIGRVLYPRMNKEFGASSDSDKIKELVLAPTFTIGTLLANTQLIVLVGSPLLYRLVLPKYAPGLLAGEILVLGTFFVCILRNGANYLIAAHEERLFLKYIIVALVFNVITDVALVKFGFGMEGVALGTGLSGALLSTLVWRKVLLKLGLSRRIWLYILEMYTPVLVLSGLFFAASLFTSAFREISPAHLIISLLVLVLLNGVLACIPIYNGEFRKWKCHLGQHLRQVAAGNFRFVQNQP